MEKSPALRMIAVRQERRLVKVSTGVHPLSIKMNTKSAEELIWPQDNGEGGPGASVSGGVPSLRYAPCRYKTGKNTWRVQVELQSPKQSCGIQGGVVRAAYCCLF